MNVLKKLHVAGKNTGACYGKEAWLNTQSDTLLTSYNPSNEKPLAHVYPATRQDYDTLMDIAQQRFLKWRTVPAPKRGDLIRQIGVQLREKKSLLGDLIALETGKTKQEADGEVQEMIDMADLAVGQSRMLYGNTMHSERPQHRMYEQWHPLGVVGVITAFNFPVAVWAWNAFIAVIAGNTVIWKPSSKTPLSTLAIQHICNDVMYKNDLDGIFSCLITEDHDVKQALVEDTRIALLSFTGSSKVGYQISETVAKRMGRCLLECSGNNAVIIDETADLSLAIPAVVFGAIGTAGQRCTSTRRVFVHTSIMNTVTQKLITAYQSLQVGDPLNEQHHMGPLIDRNAVNQFKQAIDALQQAGGDILLGGHIIEGPGYFVEPTLVRAKNEWDIVQQETFAPILYLIPYTELDQAIAMQNAVNQGLSSSLFTTHIQHAEYFLSAQGSDCGIANVNIGTSGAEIGGAFGGEKATGGGREAGSDAWKSYMRRQTNTINWGDKLPLAQDITFTL